MAQPAAAAAALVRDPLLAPVEDFYTLRREGIGHVAELGSRQWTDYNVHDPGITLLEALCYAITDLGYRLGWDIADLLTPGVPADAAQPYPHQPFFTARDILTVNPTTPDDLRRLLIDLPAIRNAWLVCKACACETSYFAWSDDRGQLRLGYSAPAGLDPPAREVWARGMYEVLLELEADPELGDLGDRMIIHHGVHHDAAGAHPIVMELRFPEVALLDRDGWLLFLDGDAAFADETGFAVTLTRLGTTPGFDVFADLATPAARDAYLRAHWNGLFHVGIEITIASPARTIAIGNASLRVLGDAAARNAASAADWRELFTDRSAAGVVRRYRRKAKAARAAVAGARQALREHRNLDEECCFLATAEVEDIAVCADVEVAPDADIERVQAEIWWAIEQYLDPPIRFRTLREQLDAGVAVEDIFDGPALDNGFIDQADLDAAALKTVVRGSDIIHRLMRIDGVRAVNQLRLTRYDAAGAPVKGAADPTWVAGQPVFDPDRPSAAWLLFLAPRSRPRLYLNLSRFLFYKNGLPFRPRLDEATDALNQLRGRAERPKLPGGERDLPIPRGAFRDPGAYFPVQHGLPLAYGVGPAGLPASATARRRAQALDLKAYLMVFEQLLGNAFEQLGHVADLFSLDPAVARTRFVKALGPGIVSGHDKVVALGAAPTIEALAESRPQFLARRNLLLDHLLARFGEQFGDYALLLTGVDGAPVAQQRLIETKIAFLERYPRVSHDRFKTFERDVAGPDGDPGIKPRIALLLGHPDLVIMLAAAAPSGGAWPVGFALMDGDRHRFDGSVTVAAADEPAAREAARRHLLDRMSRPDAYDVAAAGAKFRLRLLDGDAAELGRHPQLFDTRAAAAAEREELVAWSAAARMIVVEHLLLRPKFPGDALYPACCEGPACCDGDGDGDCCGAEDPYSFRLTVVMPGWTERYTGNLDLRRFAERTIRQETPAHLLPRICWVGNDGWAVDPCAAVVGDLAALFVAEGETAGGTRPGDDDACTAAVAILDAFGRVFADWYADRRLAFLHADALDAQLAALFAAAPLPADVPVPILFPAPLWAKVRALVAAHFAAVARDGWQFERFEWAWGCWLAADAAIDWSDERLAARVEAIVVANLLAPPPPGGLRDRACAAVTAQGEAFHAWMEGNLAAGNALEALSPFDPPPVALGPGLSVRAGTAETIAALLDTRYAAYRAPSYWLRVVVTLLARLRNVYPGATLHDCDDGGDGNPVRLNSTALGNHPHRATPD